MLLFEYLDKSRTAWHAAENAAAFLKSKGFTPLDEGEKWEIAQGGKYFTVRDGSSVIAFTAGGARSYNIVASHADSPAFKLKYSPEISVDNYIKYNVERYGGTINYSWLDTPLTVAGRVILSDENGLESRTFTSAHKFVIPSVAIHFNRTVNDGIKLNVQTDMLPLAGLSGGGLKNELREFAGGKKIAGYDLFMVSATAPFGCGYGGGLFSSPRIDNLTSAFASVQALEAADAASVAVAYIADNEEVGSATKQGAGSTFLPDVLRRINAAFGGGEEDYIRAVANSFVLSCDNAHALHPNHPEYSDITNRTHLGGGIVIKRHANQNYTTDAMSSAVAERIFDAAGAKYQYFFMRSDLPCGGTLGAISSSQVSARSADIGIAQLAMHSCIETASLEDYNALVKGLTAFYSSEFSSQGNSVKVKI